MSKYNKELRDRIEQNLRMFDYPRFDDGDIEALIGEIDHLTAELAELRERTRWIPVSEGLPEDSGRYICAIRYNEEPKKMWVEQRFWNIFGWDMYTSIVTHWMPLPEPPEEIK